MFRSGSSEYAINGDSSGCWTSRSCCRTPALAARCTSSSGRAARPGPALGPGGRRAVIEEAVGVLKHRKRKEKALRKLDAMQGNLTRVQDLTVELRRQLKPLGKQAEIARRAAVIQADLRDARLRLLADDLVTLGTKLEQEAADEAAIRERRTDTERALAEAQQREAVLEAEEAEQAPRLAQVQDTWFQMSALKERLRASPTSPRSGTATPRKRARRSGAAATPRKWSARPPRSASRRRCSAPRWTRRRTVADAVQERTGVEEALAAEERRLQAAARAPPTAARNWPARAAGSRRCAARRRPGGRRSGGSPRRARRPSSAPTTPGSSSRRSRPRSSRIRRSPPSTRSCKRRSRPPRTPPRARVRPWTARAGR